MCFSLLRISSVCVFWESLVAKTLFYENATGVLVLQKG